MRNNKNNISCNVRNITLNIKNITSHFIGKVKIITLISTIIMLSFVNIALCLSSASNTSALSYSSDVNIGFTFNPTISLSISPDNLTISNLTPGTAAESNTITVNVATNTAYGYHLTTNVGSDTTNYNTTNLVHASSASSIPTSNATFTSLVYGASVANKDNLSANTWGYSYSNDSGTTWQPYGGLPLYSDTNHSTELISTYDPADSKSVDFKIAAGASNTQPSGEYTNIINFYAVANSGPPLLYDLVEDMTKGTLAENNVNLSDPITQANSGVYTYDPTVYGTASDASNDYNIYFYRGILDSNLDGTKNTYGSNGDGKNYPNYVKLGDTCWRIVRTTGSGGTKMIYNGLYPTGTNPNSCANALTDAQITTRAFGLKGNSEKLWYKNINRIGYTFDNSVEMQDLETPISVNTIFGDSNNYSIINTQNSNIKDYIENDWFNSAIGNYENKLEPSAGYCNDRSIYDASGNLLTSSIIPYMSDNSGVEIYRFGASKRNNTTAALRSPSLTCPRGKVDIYATNGSSMGNSQLAKPVTLLTADEMVFAGSIVANYNYEFYLRSGSLFYLLSPGMRDSRGVMKEICLHPDGVIEAFDVDVPAGVRPVISLMHHIQVTSGSGTATSPWTIE